MKKLKLNLVGKYFLYALLALVCLSSCDTMNAESDYNARSWELKQKNEELDYIERLYRIKSGIEFEQKIAKIDSLIEAY